MVGAPSTWTVQEVRVDYLTLTGKTDEQREHLIARGQHLTRLREQEGSKVTPFVWMGYRGLSAGDCSWGIRDDGSLLRVSGDCASEVWRDCARHYGNCTRIDFAVTAQSNVAVRRLAHDTYTAVDYHQKAHVPNGIASLVVDNHGGSTCYIGSRTSERFARLYNKEAESGDAAYERSWRWEVEYKGEAANAVLRDLYAARVSQQFIRATVHRHFSDRGATPIWSADGNGAATTIKRKPTDNAMRLEWLRVQVAPSVARAVYHSGLLTVIHALGLEKHMNPSVLSLLRGTPSVNLSETDPPQSGANGSANPST